MGCLSLCLKFLTLGSADGSLEKPRWKERSLRALAREALGSANRHANAVGSGPSPAELSDNTPSQRTAWLLSQKHPANPCPVRIPQEHAEI